MTTTMNEDIEKDIRLLKKSELNSSKTIIIKSLSNLRSMFLAVVKDQFFPQDITN